VTVLRLSERERILATRRGTEVGPKRENRMKCEVLMAIRKHREDRWKYRERPADGRKRGMRINHEISYERQVRGRIMREASGLHEW
jgi:hypothetical protein